ncbi:TPA: type IV pilus biogenesis/stability protein PilW [Haemophilus influenzae]
MKTISKQLSAVIFPFIFSACVSQSASSLNHQAAAKARVELALSYLQQNNPQLAKINLDKALQHDKNYYLVRSALAHYYQQQGEIENAHREYEIAQQQFELALNSPNYYHQADTFENIVLCAYSAQKMDIYQQTLEKLRQIDGKRAEKFNSLK